MVRDYRHTDKWVPGTIVRKLGPVTYQVDLGKGNIVKRHVDQLTQCFTPPPPDSTSKETSSIGDNFHYPETTEPLSQEPVSDSPPSPRYPQRLRRPPDRFEVFKN